MKTFTVLSCIALLAGVTTAQTSSPVPAGTSLMVKLDTTLATFSNKAGDPFQARLTAPVVVNGQTVIPAGATVEMCIRDRIDGERALFSVQHHTQRREF